MPDRAFLGFFTTSFGTWGARRNAFAHKRAHYHRRVYALTLPGLPNFPIVAFFRCSAGL